MNMISRFFARLFGRRKKVTNASVTTDDADVLAAFREDDLHDSRVDMDARTTNYPRQET